MSWHVATLFQMFLLAIELRLVDGIGRIGMTGMARSGSQEYCSSVILMRIIQLKDPKRSTKHLIEIRGIRYFRCDAAILGPHTLPNFSLLKADGDWWSGDWKKGGGLLGTSPV